VRLILRPLSFYLTPWCLYLTPNVLTWFRLGLTVVSWPLLIEAPIVASVVLLLNHLLDCVDGNVARMQDRATYWGKFLDGWIDTLGIVVPPLVLGIAVWRETGNSWWLLMGAVASLLIACTDLTRSRASFIRVWQAQELRALAIVPQAMHKLTKPMEQAEDRLASTLSNLTILWPFLLWLPQGVVVSLAVVSVGYGVIGGVWLPVIVWRIYPLAKSPLM